MRQRQSGLTSKLENINMKYLLICLLTLSFPIHAETHCQDNRVRLQILGSGGPELDDQRASTSYLIWVDNKAAVLIDAGAGSSVNFEHTGAKIKDLDAILFTHLHVDHSADLPSYIKGSFFTKRQQNLPIYGPEGNALIPATSEFVHTLIGKQGAFRYLSNYLSSPTSKNYQVQPHDVPLKPQKINHYKINDNLMLSAIPVHHGPLPALAWRVDTLGCSITISGDMNNQHETLAILAKNTDILVAHNAVPESATGIAAQLHMLPSTIGEIAQQAKVKNLILSHRMNRTLGKEQETKQSISQTYRGPIIFANDLDTVPLD